VQDENEEPDLPASSAVSSTTPADSISQKLPRARRLKRLRPAEEESTPMPSAPHEATPAVPSSLPSPPKPRRQPPRAAATRASQRKQMLQLAEEEDDEYREHEVEQPAFAQETRRCSRRLRGMPAEVSEKLQDEDFEVPSKGANFKPQRNCRLAEPAEGGQESRSAVSRPAPAMSLADSGEESSDEGAQALSRSIDMAAGGGSSGMSRTSRRRLAVDLGTDADPEVSLWSKDLEERWANASEPRPAAAFSVDHCSVEAMRKLPPESKLAGEIVFDAMGKVNLPLLLGAHKKFLTDFNIHAIPPSTAARQVGWLARQAKRIGLIDDFELRNGRLGKRKPGEPKWSQSAAELLIPEQEVRFPVRQKKDRVDGQRSEAKAEGDGSQNSDLFSDEEGEDQVERFLRRKQAVAALKSRNDGRQAHIKAITSHGVNMQDMKSALLAPSLSFDFSANEEEDKEDASGDELEVSIPEEKIEKPRKDSRRHLLKEQLQKKLRMAMAKTLSSQPVATAMPYKATAPSTDEMPASGTELSKDEFELEIEEEKTEAAPQEETEEVFKDSRRRRRLIVDDEEEKEEAAPCAKQNEASVTEAEPSLAKPNPAPPGKQKQVRLDEMFSKKSAAQEQEAAGEDVQQKDDQSVAAPVAEMVEELARRPRPLKRLRLSSLMEQDAVQTEDCLESEKQTEDVMDAEAMEEESLEEEAADEDEPLDEASFEEASFESEGSQSDMEDALRRRRAFLRRKRREAAKNQRRLEWEVEDAEDLRDPTELIAHLGTSTMTSQERERWKNGIVDKGSGFRSAEKAEAGSRKLMWARGDDDARQLYGVGGGSKPVHFLGTVKG